jgi:hypothetical protein
MRLDVTDSLLTAVHLVFGATSSCLRHLSADAATMPPMLFVYSVVLGLILLVIAYVSLRTTGALVAEVVERLVRCVCFFVALRSKQAARPLGHCSRRRPPRQPLQISDLAFYACCRRRTFRISTGSRGWRSPAVSFTWARKPRA